jgi:uncharacterized membrane protein YphA (DoxX/SURF4 family)
MTLERVVRTFVGGLILSTGVMKLAVPKLRSAWAGQLEQADLPLQVVTYHALPIVEIGVGAMLIVGILPKTGAVVVISMMAGATYVHLVVDDPDVFPLQPKEPLIPLGVIAMALYILARAPTRSMTA